MDVWIVSKARDYKQGDLAGHQYHWIFTPTAFSTLEKAQAFCEYEAEQSLTWHSYNNDDGHVAEWKESLMSKTQWTAWLIYRTTVDLYEV